MKIIEYFVFGDTKICELKMKIIVNYTFLFNNITATNKFKKHNKGCDIII